MIGGSFGAVLSGFALEWAGWTGVTLRCLGMVLIAIMWVGRLIDLAEGAVETLTVHM